MIARLGPAILLALTIAGFAHAAEQAQPPVLQPIVPPPVAPSAPAAAPPPVPDAPPAPAWTPAPPPAAAGRPAPTSTTTARGGLMPPPPDPLPAPYVPLELPHPATPFPVAAPYPQRAKPPFPPHPETEDPGTFAMAFLRTLGGSENTVGITFVLPERRDAEAANAEAMRRHFADPLEPVEVLDSAVTAPGRVRTHFRFTGTAMKRCDGQADMLIVERDYRLFIAGVNYYASC